MTKIGLNWRVEVSDKREGFSQNWIGLMTLYENNRYCMEFIVSPLFLQLSKPVIDTEKTAKEHENLQAKCRELRVQCLDLEKKKQLCK